MITFTQYLQEDFKSSSIIKIMVSGKEVDVSYDKIPNKKINFLQYIGTFNKGINTIRGVLFFINGEFINVCWERIDNSR